MSLRKNIFFFIFIQININLRFLSHFWLQLMGEGYINYKKQLMNTRFRTTARCNRIRQITWAYYSANMYRNEFTCLIFDKVVGSKSIKNIITLYLFDYRGLPPFTQYAIASVQCTIRSLHIIFCLNCLYFM